jgi:hypothetical protein
MAHPSLLLLFTISFLSLSALATEQIKMVVYITRHGARAPEEKYFTLNKDYWGTRVTDAMDLTDVGLRQHFELGSIFRTRYVEELSLISPHYNSAEIKVISSEKDRTILSAYAHTMGLYPPGTGPEVHRNHRQSALIPPWIHNYNLNQDLGFSVLPNYIQPIPVNIIGLDNDTLFHAYSKNVCPNQKEYSEMQMNTEIFTNVQKNLSEIYGSVKSKMNLTAPLADISMKTVKRIFSNLNCDFTDGRDLGLKVDDPILRHIRFMHNFYINYVLFGKEEQRQLTSYRFLTELVQYFNNSIHNETQLKLVFHSGHDYDLASLLQIFGLTTWECILKTYQTEGADDNHESCYFTPNFASSINFELYKNGERHYVKLLYNGKDVTLWNNLTFCTFEDLQEFVARKLPKTFREVCGTPPQMLIENRNNNERDSLYIMVWIMLALIALAILLLIYKFFILKDDGNNNNHHRKYAKSDESTELEVV